MVIAVAVVVVALASLEPEGMGAGNKNSSILKGFTLRMINKWKSG